MIGLYLLSCGQKEDTQSDSAFVGFKQDNRNGFMAKAGGGAYLINDVHKDQLKVEVIINGECKTHEQVKNDISDVIGIWIGGLKQAQQKGLLNIKSELVSSVDFYFGSSMFYWEDLTVNINCENGRPFFSANSYGIFSDPEINLYQNYDKNTILHEFGHSFGLADTYVENQGTEFDYMEHNISTDSDSVTRGSQTRSAMSVLDPSLISLTDDDIAGMAWSYRYYVAGDIAVDECPSGYEIEEATGGCLALKAH